MPEFSEWGGDPPFRAVPWGSAAPCCGCRIEPLTRPGDEWQACVCYCHDAARIIGPYKEKK